MRSMKTLLHRTIGEHVLRWNELLTVLTSDEAMMNSRPIAIIHTRCTIEMTTKSQIVKSIFPSVDLKHDSYLKYVLQSSFHRHSHIFFFHKQLLTLLLHGLSTGWW